jgi:hypothetical protein
MNLDEAEVAAEAYRRIEHAILSTAATCPVHMQSILLASLGDLQYRMVTDPSYQDAFVRLREFHTTYLR